MKHNNGYQGFLATAPQIEVGAQLVANLGGFPPATIRCVPENVLYDRPENPFTVSGPTYEAVVQGLLPDFHSTMHDYNGIVSEYRSNLDALMGIVTEQSTKHLKSPHSYGEDRDAVVWRIDGDITDGTFDSAVRLAARVYPFEEVWQEPDDVVYKPTASWTKQMRGLGRQGLVFLGFGSQVFALDESLSGKTPKASKTAYFTHRLPDGEEVLYIPRPTESEKIVRLPQPISFGAVLRRAYGRFIVEQARAVADDETVQAFETAVERDKQEKHGPSDNLPEFRKTVKQVPYVRTRVQNLARVLYGTGNSIFTADLLNVLEESSTGDDARAALLSRNTYASETRSHGEGKPLGHRLGWVAAANSFIYNFQSSVYANRADLGSAIEAEIDVVRALSERASTLHELMQPPKTIAMTGKNWRVNAR